MSPKLFFAFTFAATLSPLPTFAQEEEEVDLFTMNLVVFDLTEAQKMMTVYDRDEDGLVDKDEQQRIRWKDDIPQFDLNGDGNLTHLEFAIREAKRRYDDDITQSDVNNVKTFLRRYDKNNNGQLDPNEIANGWPSKPEEYDGNGDGTITATEMQYRFAFNRGLRREMGIDGVDQTAAMRLIRRFDKNNDKKLDKSEQEGVPLPRPAKDFDEDDDGSLGILELSTMHARHRRDLGLTKPDQTKIVRMFQIYDPNGDGKINEEEMSTAPIGVNAQTEFSQYDRNDDGVITIAEVEEVVAAARKEKGYIEEDFQKAVLMMRRHDDNRTKHIDEFELFEQPKKGQLAKSILRTADLNQDRRISLDELSRHFAGERKRAE